MAQANGLSILSIEPAEPASPPPTPQVTPPAGASLPAETDSGKVPAPTEESHQ